MLLIGNTIVGSSDVLVRPVGPTIVVLTGCQRLNVVVLTGYHRLNIVVLTGCQRLVFDRYDGV